MRRTLLLSLLPLTVLAACTTITATNKGFVEPLWSSPPIEHVVSVRDGRTGERVEFDAMLDELADFDAVFLGETHTDETTHRVEYATYRGLLERRDGRVTLALEMFDRDVQPALDAYVRGEIDEATFLARSRPWTNYRTAYRPMIEAARAGRHPVVASNFPAPLRRRVASEGLQALTAEERAFAPKELLANTPAYWRRVDNAIRGHAGMMGPAAAADDPRLTSVQSLWDNSMGEACALVLAQDDDRAVLHVNGGFHSEYWDGTVRQMLLRAPDARVATVAIVPTANPFTAESSNVPVADYVVYVEESARDLNEGTYGVNVPRELEYRLHVPTSANDARRVPLLVWLVDDGESAQDALALWTSRVGEHAAVLAIEPPYREIQDDLVAGGRWFWADEFAQDLSALRAGVDAACRFVGDHHPIDTQRIVLAGEGTGATVVAATALLGRATKVRALAFEPRKYASIADFPLPLPELRDPSRPRIASTLRVDAREADRAWWTKELEQYRVIEFDADFAAGAKDAWSVEVDRENAVRAALGIPARAVAADAARTHVVVDGARARSWARLDARTRAERVAILDAEPDADSGSSALDLRVRAEDCGEPGRIPACPGSFGGTTVIVLGADATAEEIAAWRALEAADPLAKASRFQRMVVAESAGERALPVVLDELAAKNRKNVLIVPATWCADGATMRALRRSVRAYEDRMTVQWRPGLGGTAAR